MKKQASPFLETRSQETTAPWDEQLIEHLVFHLQIVLMGRKRILMLQKAPMNNSLQVNVTWLNHNLEYRNLLVPTGRNMSPVTVSDPELLRPRSDFGFFAELESNTDIFTGIKHLVELCFQFGSIGVVLISCKVNVHE